MECRLFSIVPAGCAGKYDSARKNYLGHDLQDTKITGEIIGFFPPVRLMEIYGFRAEMESSLSLISGVRAKAE